MCGRFIEETRQMISNDLFEGIRMGPCPLFSINLNHAPKGDLFQWSRGGPRSCRAAAVSIWGIVSCSWVAPKPWATCRRPACQAS